MFLKNLIKNSGFTLLEMLVVLAVLAILLSLVSPNISMIAERASQAVQAINAKMFRTNATYDLVLNNRSNIRISETVNLSTIGEVQDVEVTYAGTDTLKMLVSIDRGNSWHSYTINEQASIKDMFGGYVNAINLRWELVDHSTPDNIKDHALSIDDFNSLTQAEWLEILRNADVVTFAFNATDSEGNDITWDINPELSIVVTGTDGSESVVFPEETADDTGGSETGGETPSIADITLPADSSNLFADGTHRDNGDSTDNYDLVNAVTDSADNFNGMFSNAGSFNEDIGGWNTSNVTDFGNMFNGAGSFDQDLSGWDFSSATNINGIANNAGFSQDNYNKLVDAIYNTNTQGWGISDIINAIGTTGSGIGYTGEIEDNNYVSIEDASIILPEDGYRLFEYGTHRDNGDSVDNYDLVNAYISDVVNSSKMFNGAKSFNQDISLWDTSNITNMSGMFAGTDSFNQDIGNWDTSNVVNMGSLFTNTDLFNQDIGNWDTSNVNSMYGLLQSSKSFDQDISSWDFSSVTNIEWMLYESSLSNENYSKLLLKLYQQAINGKLTPNLELGTVSHPNGDFKHVTNLSYSKFNGTSAEGITALEAKNYLVNQYGLIVRDAGATEGTVPGIENGFNPPKTVLPENSYCLFEYGDHRDTNLTVHEFNLERNIDTSSVVDIGRMFNGAKSFNQDISLWDFSNVTNMSAMVYNSGLDQSNYNKLVDAIHRDTGISISEIVNEINLPINVSGYTGSN